jgi:hypothetical protein
MVGEPFHDFGMLVCAVVVQDGVNEHGSYVSVSALAYFLFARCTLTRRSFALPHSQTRVTALVLLRANYLRCIEEEKYSSHSIAPPQTSWLLSQSEQPLQA